MTSTLTIGASLQTDTSSEDHLVGNKQGKRLQQAAHASTEEALAVAVHDSATGASAGQVAPDLGGRPRAIKLVQAAESMTKVMQADDQRAACTHHQCVP